MAVTSPSSQVLDLLFDQNDGVLKSEFSSVSTKPAQSLIQVPEDVGFPATDAVPENNLEDLKLFDLADLDILSDDIFSTLLSSSVLNSEEEQAVDKSVAKQVQTDHDYFAQKSPSNNSDSGISLESMGSNSPRLSTDDQSEVLVLEDQISQSPGGNSSSFDQEMSPVIGYEGLDLNDINVNFSGLDSTDFIEQFDFEMNEPVVPADASETVSIDFNGIQEPMESLSDSTIDVDTCHKTKTVQIHSYHSRNSSADGGLPFTVQDVSPQVTSPSSSSSSQFPQLRLTDEEKELLLKENIVLPENMPLTKEEEKQLRAVRRKIRNKVSAKESRKRKGEYVEGLEQRVKLCTVENSQLQKKIENLEKQNMSMLSQLRKLQALVTSKTTPAQTSTCLMVLLLSFALLVVPSFSPLGRSSLSSDHPKSIVMPGKSRSLLYNTETQATDDDPYGVSHRPNAPWEDKPQPLSVQPPIAVNSVNEKLIASDLDVEMNETEDLAIESTVVVSEISTNQKDVIQNSLPISDQQPVEVVQSLPVSEVISENAKDL